MQQRITFVHKPSDAIDPRSINVKTDSISFSALKAVREDRTTINFDELPSDIRLVLEQSHEIHIRYVKDLYQASTIPFVSRASPGLHVSYTPRTSVVGDKSGSATESLCRLLRSVFGIVDEKLCDNVDRSFTRLPSQRFQHSAAFSFYLSQDQFSPSSIARYLLPKCPPASRPCREQLYLFSKASSTDASYSAISNTLITTITTPSQTWNTNITSHLGRLEVGLLSNEKAFEPEHLSMGGFLVVVGEDTKPSPVHFSFPSRHHPHPSTYSTSFIEPTGLHPTLLISIPDLIIPNDGESCALHSYLTLPKHIFIDKYQFTDTLFLASKNLTSIRYLSPNIDLEAPSYTVPSWGASLLLELSTPPLETLSTAQSYTAQIPLHLRYMLPQSNSSYREAIMPEPVVFWACRGAEGSKYSVNPFDRVHLGYDGLFGPRTSFHHLNPVDVRGTGGYLNIDIPVLNRQWARTVEWGTAFVVFMGFLWVLYKLGLVLRKAGFGNGIHDTNKRKGSKKNN